MLVDKGITKGITKEEFQDFFCDHQQQCVSDILIKDCFGSIFQDLLSLPGFDHIELNEAHLILKL